MAKRVRCRPAIVWKVESVTVKARDGPERMAQVYRRLLLPTATSSANPPKEQLAAREKGVS